MAVWRALLRLCPPALALRPRRTRMRPEPTALQRVRRIAVAPGRARRALPSQKAQRVPTNPTARPARRSRWTAPGRPGSPASHRLPRWIYCRGDALHKPGRLSTQKR